MAYPIIAFVLLGPLAEIPDALIMDSFVDFVSVYEGQILREALQVSCTTSSYVEDLGEKFLAALVVDKSPLPTTYSNLFMVLHDTEFW